MKSQVLLCTLSLLCATVAAVPAQDSAQRVLENQASISPDTILSRLRKTSVIPDVLPEDFEPKLILSLTYPEAHDQVFYGNVIKPENTTSRPVLQISDFVPTRTSRGNKTYTLVLSDPDATSHSKPVKGQMCHWIATGIDAHAVSPANGGHQLELRSFVPSDHLDSMDAHELVEYLPPSPPPKTGFHRYVFVLLEPESPEHNDRKLKKPKGRPRWGFKKQGKGVMKWAKKNRLVPVAANYFLAENGQQ